MSKILPVASLEALQRPLYPKLAKPRAVSFQAFRLYSWGMEKPLPTEAVGTDETKPSWAVGTGRLADIIGVEAAEEYFTSVESCQRYNTARALGTASLLED
jgi:hypothetical protein